MRATQRSYLLSALYAAWFALIGVQLLSVLRHSRSYLFHELSLSRAELPFILGLFALFALPAYLYFQNQTKTASYGILPIWSMIYLLVMSLKSGIITVAVGSWLISLALLVLLERRLKPEHKILRLFARNLFIIHSVSLPLIGFLMSWEARGEKRFPPLTWGANSQATLALYGLIAFVIIFILAKILFAKYPRALDGKHLAKGLQLMFCLAALLHILVLGLVLAGRVLALRAPTFDHGLFTQMFFNLIAGNGPVTTLERDMLLSHFAVHISPIYYLLVPIFALFPSALTLQILQILIVASGVIPCFLLARHFQLPKAFVWLAGILFVANPGLIGSSLYDFHENCFLAPCLLWLLYFLHSKRPLGVVIFTVLTLAIKEDAALYLVGIGLYALTLKDAGRRKAFNALILIIIPLIYFFGAIWYLNQFGSGAMTGRFANVMAYPELGLPGVALTMLQNATFVIAGLFRPDKLTYLVIVLASFGFLPLFQKKWSTFVLFLPLVIMNLLSDYQYQHNIGFQYHYGTSVFLLFMALLALRDQFALHKVHLPDLKSRRFQLKQVSALLIAGAIAATTISANLLDSRTHNWRDYLNNREELHEVRAALDRIPRTKSVVADTNLTSHLADIELLYDIKYHRKAEGTAGSEGTGGSAGSESSAGNPTMGSAKSASMDPTIDFVVIDKRYENADRDAIVDDYIASGYAPSELSLPNLLILAKE